MRTFVASTGHLAPVTTMLLPGERSRVDAAGEGLYRTLHRDTLDDVFRDIRDRRAAAVVVSVARCGETEITSVARLVREFPRITAVALLSGVEEHTPRAVLGLGHSGVRALVDVRRSDGWRELRNLLTVQAADEINRLALRQLALDLAGVPNDCWRFFEMLFDGVPTASVRTLCNRLRVLPSTLMSRFFRASLPSPKRYLSTARIVYAARALENPGLSVSNVANQLDYSSPQSFSRHVRHLIGLTALDLRQHYDGEGMFLRFREELILPYMPILRRFAPLTPRSRWAPAAERALRSALEALPPVAR